MESESRIVKLDYPSNNHKTKTEDKPKREIKKVVTGKVTKEKKSIGQKFAETFVGDDMKSVSSYLIEDVLLPQLRDVASDVIDSGLEAIRDMINGAADVIIFGEIQENKKRGRKKYTDYGSIYYSGKSNKRSSERAKLQRKSRSRFDIDQITFDERDDANAVLSDMIDILEEEEFVSVADFYILVGLAPEFVHDQWGWDNLKSAKVRRISNGQYVIALPKPIPNE